MLSLIGIGLSDADDITLKGLNYVRSADTVYLEGYTSRINASKEELEDLYEQDIVVASREQLEQRHDELLDEAAESHVVVLIIGDVFSATTHSMVFVEAKNRGIPVNVVHNASIINAVSQTGLQLYKFGRTTSIVYPDGDWLPSTPYDAIEANQEQGLHTLCLLDIKADNAGFDDRQDTYMTAQEAVHILRRLEETEGQGVIRDDSDVIVVQDLTGPNQTLWEGTVGEVDDFEAEQPLHSLIVPAELHDMEAEMLRAQTTVSSC